MPMVLEHQEENFPASSPDATTRYFGQQYAIRHPEVPHLRPRQQMPNEILVELSPSQGAGFDTIAYSILKVL